MLRIEWLNHLSIESDPRHLVDYMYDPQNLHFIEEQLAAKYQLMPMSVATMFLDCASKSTNEVPRALLDSHIAEFKNPEELAEGIVRTSSCFKVV